MESKLPKPSGLKRPTPVIPTDRIKSAVLAFGSRNINASTAMHTVAPLTRDPTNVAYLNRVTRDQGRAMSPEVGQINNTFVPCKLRRSRSACDIRPNRKRVEMTLAPIPSKAPRLLGTIPQSSSNPTIGVSRTVRQLGTTTAATSSVIHKRLPPIQSIVNKATTKVVPLRTAASSVACSMGITKKTSASTATSISTTGASKPINKRIPPYDYKARYNDLVEKHKAIKDKLDEKNELLANYENLPEQLEESQNQLLLTMEQLKKANTELESLKQQVQSQSLKIDVVTASLVNTKGELEQLRKDHKIISEEHGKFRKEVVELRTENLKLKERNVSLEEEMINCKEQLFRSNMERKELHNTVLDLRGNIRVFCRVRPPLGDEMEKQLCQWNYLDETTLEILNPDLIGKNKPSGHIFNFDYVFHQRSLQEDIFEMVSPLIQSAMDGYNICIFAYGQTGSGKTYTMDGESSNPGVIPRTVELLFEAVNNYKRLGWEYEIKVTFLEIYNEVLYDLLSNEQKDMEIRISKTNHNDVYVSNITVETVTTANRLRELMHLAKMNRATAATVGNERSSRSHAVTKIELIGLHKGKNEFSIGTINLVDLAGSESPKTSIRMAETKNINRSLSELTNVILALMQKQDHIPYRNSKLTHLLMPSLGGNSKTLMFINVAPFTDCFVESVKSLRFAASVNSCKLAKAKRNRFLNTSSGAIL